MQRNPDEQRHHVRNTTGAVDEVLNPRLNAKAYNVMESMRARRFQLIGSNAEGWSLWVCDPGG